MKPSPNTIRNGLLFRLSKSNFRISDSRPESPGSVNNIYMHYIFLTPAFNVTNSFHTDVADFPWKLYSTSQAAAFASIRKIPITIHNIIYVRKSGTAFVPWYLHESKESLKQLTHSPPLRLRDRWVQAKLLWNLKKASSWHKNGEKFIVQITDRQGNTKQKHAFLLQCTSVRIYY